MENLIGISERSGRGAVGDGGREVSKVDSERIIGEKSREERGWVRAGGGSVAILFAGQRWEWVWYEES